VSVTIKAMKTSDIGLTDFTLAGLQAALDYVGLGGGGQVYVAPGLLPVTNVVSIYSNTWLCGSGINSTILQRTVGAVNVIQNKTFVGTQDQDIQITDMTLDGNVQGGVGGHCLRFTNVARGKIQRCKLLNPLSTGVGVYGTSAGPGLNRDIDILDNIFDTTTDSGIDFTDCIGGRIAGNRFYSISQTGINVEPRNVGGVVEYVKGLRILGNHYDVPSASGAGYGIHLQGYSFGTYDGTIEDVVVSGNTIKSAKAVGIKVEGKNNLAIEVSGNVVMACGNQGIWVRAGSTAAKNVTVSRNTVVNCSTSGVAAFSGIHIENATNCSTSENTVIDTATPANHKYGIEESSGTTATSLGPNVVYGSSVGDVAPLGTHSTRKTFGNHDHYGVFTVRQDSTQRYRGSFFRTGTEAFLNAVDDNTGINQPVVAQQRAEMQFVLTDAATIAVDASQGNLFIVTLTANRIMGLPTNLPTAALRTQKLTFKIIQDGTGGRNLTWHASYKHAWSDVGNTAGKFSTISFRYDGTNLVQDGAQSPYI
jgi:hypothetical protein